MLQLALPDGSRPEIVVSRRARRTIGIRVLDGRIELAAHARVPLSMLQRVLDEKRDWIWRHWQRQQALLLARAAAPQAVCLQGRPLALLCEPARPAGAALTDDALRVGGTAGDVRAQVAHFLFCQAAEVFPRHLRRLAPLAARAPGQLLLSSARTRWGSCHRDGRIRLNWRLIQAPPTILDYVIAHELAHLRHMNHSPAFWQETGRLYPDWRTARAWLRRQGESLFDFG
ncbi:M48 family metallopeptidase [Paludibacterium purpuratum]|uniref:M48 family metallopeptidase n=1 Tax=Paludibacterium purpuratum TaxID=1144873 RepID=UPI001FB6DDC8|nr:SprT family zinc-dependent metalloprotease [Paludibacterium purpuratum]